MMCQTTAPITFSRNRELGISTRPTKVTPVTIQAPRPIFEKYVICRTNWVLPEIESETSALGAYSANCWAT